MCFAYREHCGHSVHAALSHLELHCSTPTTVTPLLSLQTVVGLISGGMRTPTGMRWSSWQRDVGTTTWSWTPQRPQRQRPSMGSVWRRSERVREDPWKHPDEQNLHFRIFSPGWLSMHQGIMEDLMWETHTAEVVKKVPIRPDSQKELPPD